ncbi:polysaccharide lyase family 14 protein [Pholiota conissans]|uniref:Polysaccharide lyase family 14 protein n=1 Tax=Pholiota conissans TaxID=109636 RepID=A0A9P5Z6B3_9AGAR|nr:polysaccharide lyase family 14 protein [Pholiota conissans]
MQLFYPANSIDPAQKPQGGADFYAEPLDISDATNVTLEYSVFFPNDFDWVLAGKLPGMYGGHTGCSGGNAALDCFSTRMMWRQDGEGELYLYAPKDKQTKELCDDPKSSCDEAYGLSIGRGSFKWAAGSWTNIRQTISLNTPGEQDGSFTLDVNGQRKIDRNDVFYREDLGSRKSHAKTTHAPPKTTTFFGGHEEKYATPRDQYVWFKDFAVSYNS